MLTVEEDLSILQIVELANISKQLLTELPLRGLNTWLLCAVAISHSLQNDRSNNVFTTPIVLKNLH